MQGRVVFHVACPTPEVFALVSDLERAPEWVPDLVSVEKTTPGPVGVGTRYREVVRMGRQTSEAEIEVTEFEPGRWFAHRGRGGPSRFTGTFLLEPEGDGTRVTHEWSVEMTGVFRLLAPFAGRWVRRNVEQGVANLKAQLEP